MGIRTTKPSSQGIKAFKTNSVIPLGFLPQKLSFRLFTGLYRKELIFSILQHLIFWIDINFTTGNNILDRPKNRPRHVFTY